MSDGPEPPAAHGGPPSPPLPSTWAAAGGDRLEVIESDLRALMREAGELRFAAAEAERSGRAAQRKRLLALVGVLDAFDRVLRSVEAKPDKVTPQMAVWLGNFRSVRRLLEKLVAEEGVRRLETLSQEFDPAFHTVVETVRDEQRPDGGIVEEQEPGYLWHKEIQRKAQVVVVRNG